MAITTIATTDNLAAKLWSKTLFRDVLDKMFYKQFVGEGSNSIVQILPETKKRAGDKVTYGLRMQLSGTGRTGQEVLEGNEEDLTFYDAALYIDLMRHAVKVDTTISQQRLEYNLRREARDALSDWWAERLDDYTFRYLAGDTSLTFAGNTAASADASHVVFASTCTAETSMTTAHVFTIDLIDKAVLIAKTVTPRIRPVRVEGENYWVLMLHPKQVYDLRISTATGAWLDLHKSTLMGGKIKDNPIFKGSLGVYNNVILYESNNVHSGTYGAGAAPVYRANFLGAQAGCIAFGQTDNIDQFTWVEKKFDYDKNFGVAANLTWGIQKNRFNSLDYGAITISSCSSRS